MRIGINTRSLLPGKIGGLEHHFRGLLDAMLRAGRPHRYFLYTNPENHASFDHLTDLVNRHILRDFGRNSAVSEAVRETNPDIVFHPFLFVEPMQLDALNAALIPDVRYARHPEGTPEHVLKVWRKRFPETARRAELLFTNSEASKADLVDFLRADPGKIRVTGLGVEARFGERWDAGRLAGLRERHRLPRQFLYYPADTWPHKNHRRLFAALRRLRKAGRRIVLALSGIPNASESSVTRDIARAGIADQVIRLGYLPRGEQPGVYQAATALVFPSYYEGWGMPVSEALAGGTPVICGRVSSLPEVAGDAAEYFDPFDERDIARAILAVVDSPDRQAELAAAGPAQAALHTWEKAAAITLDGLEQAGRPALELVDPLPLVSVVIPTYKQGRYLAQCIDSVLTQDYPHLEVLVLDANSPDETREILPRYSNRIRWISRKDRGQTDAINQGLRSARGEIHGYLCSDDLLMPGAIRKAVAYLVGHPECDLMYGQGWHIDGDDKIIERYPTEPFEDEVLAYRCFICQPAAFWRRRLYDKAGWFDDDHHLHNGMDYEYWMRVAKTSKVGWIDDYLAMSRLWQGSKTLDRRSHLLLMSVDAVKRHYGEVPMVWVNAYVDQRTIEGRFERFGPRLGGLLRKHYRRGLQKFMTGKYNGWRSLLGAGQLEPREGYMDGWMGSWYQRELLLPPASRVIRITGSFPTWPMHARPELQVAVEGRALGRARMPGIGAFQLEFPLPPALAGKDKLKLTIHSPRHFVPSRHDPASVDDRRLSCQIHAVEVAS